MPNKIVNELFEIFRPSNIFRVYRLTMRRVHSDTYFRKVFISHCMTSLLLTLICPILGFVTSLFSLGYIMLNETNKNK